MKLHKSERVKLWFIDNHESLVDKFEEFESADGHKILIATNSDNKIEMIDILEVENNG